MVAICSPVRRRNTHDAFTQRTISLHFKPDTTGTPAAIQTLYEEGDADRGFAVRYLSDTGEITVRAYNGGIYTVNLSMELATAVDGWHQVVVAIHADGFTQLFVDGADPASDYFDGGSMGARTDNAGLGYTNSEDVYDDSAAAKFKGLLDDVRIYDSILTADQLTALREGRELSTVNAPTLPIPVAHWNMEPVAAISPDNRMTIYGYGDNNNGTKQTTKTVYEGPDYTGNLGDLVEEHIYAYDVAGRMTTVTITKDEVTVVEEYGYNDQNLRISRSVTESGNTTVTEYLLDTNNPTGYSQTLEEYVDDELSKTYTIGHDVIAQYDDEHGVLTFLYDGHGSTRALVDDSGEIVQQFAYEAYGTMIVSAELTAAAQAWTTIQYSGEHFNANTGLQRLQVRDLQLSTATFTTRDPIVRPDDHSPISHHKYLYANANPVMNIDPSGKFSIGFNSTFTAISMVSTLSGIVGGSISKVTGGSFWEGFSKGFISTQVTLSIMAFTPIKSPNIALALGQIVSNTTVDIVSGKAQSDPRLFVGNLAISVVSGIFLNSMWRNLVPGLSTNTANIAAVIERGFPQGSLDTLARELGTTFAKSGTLGLLSQIPKTAVKTVVSIINWADEMSEEYKRELEEAIRANLNGG